MKTLKKLAALLLVMSILATCFSTAFVTEAASYPLLVPKEYKQNAYIGDSVDIEYSYFPKYKNERIDVEIYDSNGSLVATSSRTFYHTSTYMTEYTVSWDTDSDYKPDRYKVVATNYFYTFYSWHTAPTATTSYVVLEKRVPKKPSAPIVESIKNTATGVRFSWHYVSNAQSYRVYRKTSSTSWKLIKTTTSCAYTDKTVKEGKQYQYKVCAVNKVGASTYDKTCTIKYLKKPVLSKPTNSNAGVKVKWKKVVGAKGYYIFRKSGDEGFKKIATVKGGSKVAYIDKSAKAGITYRYTVRAFSDSYSSTNDTKGVAVRHLKTPSLKSIKRDGQSIVFAWNKVKGAKGYFVYKKIDSGKWTKVATLSSSASAIRSTSVKKGKTYSFTVKAYYGTSTSACNAKGLKIKF